MTAPSHALPSAPLGCSVAGTDHTQAHPTTQEGGSAMSALTPEEAAA